MQKLFVAFLLAFLNLNVAAQNKIDVLHYKFSIEVNDKNDSVLGVAEIKVRSLHTSEQFDLDLIAAGQGVKGMKVSSVAGPNVLRFMSTSEKLTVLLSDSFLKDDSATFTVMYAGIPDDGLIISKNKFGKRTFFSDNWPNRARYWIPCNDDPSDKASVEFLITAPAHYKVVANGILQEEKELSQNKKLTHWKEDVPLPTKVMAIGVADFAVDNVDTVKGIPVSSWVYKENRTDGFKDYSIAPSILSFMMDYIGPYPYKKLANVQSTTIFGGMENASAIFYDERTVDGRQDDESLIAHEIAHQWFGDMATEKSFAHLWLSEGFATYLAHRYLESKYGADHLNAEMKSDRDKIIAFARNSRQPVVDSVSDFMELLNPNSYEKGGWILHMLRRQLGDAVFQQIIRKYYETYAGKNAETKDLQKIVEEVSGKDFSVFFQQWLYVPGVPELDIEWKRKEKEVEFTVTQKQQILFSFPLEVATSMDKRMSGIKTVHISKREETFTIPSVLRPDTFIADPAISLLADIRVKQE